MSDLDTNATAPDPAPAPDSVPAPAPSPAPATAPAPAPSPAPAPAPAPVAAPAPDFATVPAPVAAPAPAPRSRRALRVTAAVAAAVLAGVGIGVGIIKVKYGDPAPVAAPAPAAVPSAAPSTAQPYGASSNGVHFGSLLDLLLPLPAGYRLGPDDGLDGNDTALTAAQLSAEIDDETSDLPKDQRNATKDELRSLGMRAAGVRSYRTADAKMVVTLRLLQFNQNSVRAFNAFTGALGADSGLNRQGPEVPGHTDARCFLPAEDPGEPIDVMLCSGAVGDLLVTMRVEGVAPLPKSEAVSIFRQQLERLALPGASV
ncbi:hypothetical protein GCM10009665_48530 [Kitasatospora nipponensis]|uniref:LytR cell envelope-related transcriptional attenuator n=1 Tax=Kitasatospora nipponensis TaxID=258049 RepID=A0ABP4H7F7_9ACTN